MASTTAPISHAILREAARRTAWIIGGLVLAIYVIGFFFKRG